MAEGTTEGSRSYLAYSELYRTLEWRLNRFRTFRREATSEPPTYITGEDSLSIEVFMDANSPEWQWLASIYGELQDAVRADNATLVIAVFPLAYQLDDDYPFLPQKLFDRYCNQNAIHCIDLLPAFRKYPKDDVFLLNHPDRPDIYDIWHLTEYGHEISASVISTFLRSRNLLRGRHAGESTKMFESGASAAPG